METRQFTFLAGGSGTFLIRSQTTCLGEPLPSAGRLSLLPSAEVGQDLASAAAWLLRGTTSNTRYTTHSEQDKLRAVQAPVGRPSSIHGALIPIRKSSAWWALSQDERREIFEERSHHISGTLKYLPDVARKLFHSRDLAEPFDFLTWFDFQPQHESAFDELLATLRASQEWQFVEREIDIRVSRVV